MRAGDTTRPVTLAGLVVKDSAATSVVQPTLLYALKV